MRKTYRAIFFHAGSTATASEFAVEMLLGELGLIIFAAPVTAYVNGVKAVFARWTGRLRG